jgi:hypothetical protein
VLQDTWNCRTSYDILVICYNQLQSTLLTRSVIAGGVLFKTYVVGDYVRVVRRFSLPDVQEGESRNGVMPFPRVSCATESAENADLDPQAAGIFHSSSLPTSLLTI